MATRQSQNSRGTKPPNKPLNKPLNKPSNKNTVNSQTANSQPVIRLSRSAVPSHSPVANVFRDLKPNWRSYLNYVQQAANEGDDDMQRIIDSFQHLRIGERRLITPEKLCDLAGVRPSDVIGVVCAKIWAEKSGESAIVTALLHPEIIRKTAKAAANIKHGGRDRELFFRLSGSLPDRKGASVVINNNPQALSNVEAPRPGQLPSMEADVIEMDRLLEPGHGPMTAISKRAPISDPVQED